MKYQIIHNPVTRSYRIRKLTNGTWVHAFWDLGLWTDGPFETLFRWRARYHLWRLNRMDALQTRTDSWEP